MNRFKNLQLISLLKVSIPPRFKCFRNCLVSFRFWILLAWVNCSHSIHFSELSNLKYLCRGLLLQNQLASTMHCTSEPQSIQEIEECLNVAFSSTFQEYTDQAIFFPASAQDLSFYEFILELHKYLASNKFTSFSKIEPCVEFDISKRRRVPYFETTVVKLVWLRNKSMYEVIPEILGRFIPHVFYCLVAAYRANFYYVTTKDYKRAADICDEALERFKEFSKLYDQFFHPVLISNRFSGIYDDVIQSIIGFFTLLKWQLKRMNETWCSGDPYELTLRVPAHEFLGYLRARLPRMWERIPRNYEKSQLKTFLNKLLDYVPVFLLRSRQTRTFWAKKVYSSVICIIHNIQCTLSPHTRNYVNTCVGSFSGRCSTTGCTSYTNFFPLWKRLLMGYDQVPITGSSLGLTIDSAVTL